MGVDGTPGVHAGVVAATSNGTLAELSTADGGAWGGGGDGEGQDDGDEEDIDYPDSENEEEDEETLLLRQESTSAYASAGGETRGHLDIAALRLAMITVLGRAVRESEAESRLLAVRKRTFPRQLKASVSDLFNILLGARASQPETGTLEQPALGVNSSAPSPPEGWAGLTTPEASNLLPRCPWEGSGDLAPPAFMTSSPAKAGNVRIKPPPTPRDFWKTSVGRSLGAASGVGCTNSSSGGGGGGDFSRQRDALNRSEWEDDGDGGGGDDLSRQRDTLNRSKRCNAEREESGDGGGGGGGHPILGTDVDGVASGAPPAGTGGQGCDEEASTKNVDERVLTTTSARTQENPRFDENSEPSADTSSSNGAITAPVATASSQLPTESAGGESVPARAEYDAFVEGRHQNNQNTRPMKAYGGADGDEQTRKAKHGKCPPAQGTGTKAVRSLSQVAGGRALVEEEEEEKESCLLYESANGSACKSLGRSLVFEVTPASVSLGRIEVGRRYTVKIQVANVADKPARFRIDPPRDHEGNGQRCVTVAGYARGKVAAGITVTVNIEVLARSRGPLLELLPIVAEDGTTEVIIRGEAFEAGEGPAIAALP